MVLVALAGAEVVEVESWVVVVGAAAVAMVGESAELVLQAATQRATRRTVSRMAQRVSAGWSCELSNN